VTVTLIRKLLRDIRWTLPVIMFLLFGFQALWVKATQRTTTVVAPMFQFVAQSQGASMNDVKSRLFRGPGRVMQSVIGGDQLEFQKAQDVLSIGYVHPLMQVIFCLWAVGRSASAVAGELDRGTMERLLSQPLPRWRVIFAHFCVDWITIPLLALSLWAGIWFGTTLVGPITAATDAKSPILGTPIKVDDSLLVIDRWAFGPPLLDVAALLFALSGVTMWLSASGRYRWRVIGIASIIVLVQFAMNVIGQIWDTVAFLRPLSLFYYYQPQRITLSDSWSVPLEPIGIPIQVPMILVLGGLGFVGYAMALRTFTHRDLPAPL
jgi:ABC-2 type transport system permease protein